MDGQSITKDVWVDRAKKALIDKTGDDWHPEALQSYAESCYDWAIESDEYLNEPEDAVAEDLTNWD